MALKSLWLTLMSAFLFHISYVLAQDFIRSGCTVNDTVPHVSNTTYKTLNASGSIVSPEISLTGSLSSWTWYTGVQALFNNSRVFQPIWVDTKGTDLAETNLGFEMCYLAFTGYTSDVQKRGQGDTGDCKKMLSQECIDDWKKSLTSQRNSARWNTSLATPCAQIGNTPDSCKETGGSLMQYGPIPKYNRSCPLGLGDPDYDLVTVLIDINDDENKTVDPTNFDVYDRVATRIVPFFVVGWSTNSSQWSADARIMCLSSTKVVEGSRTPPGVPSAGRRTSPLWIGGIVSCATMVWLVL